MARTAAEMVTEANARVQNLGVAQAEPSWRTWLEARFPMPAKEPEEAAATST